MPRYTVNEAARILDIGSEAIRKRIARGSLRSEIQDGTRYVWLDEYAGHVRDIESDALICEMRSRIVFLEQELERKDAILLSMTEAMKAESPSSELRGRLDCAAAAPAKGSPTDDESIQESAQRSGSQPARFVQGRVGLASLQGSLVLLAATVPVVLTTVTLGVLEGAQQNVSVGAAVLIYLAFHTIPLLCGLGVGLAWRVAPVFGYVLLGLLAGVIEGATLGLFLYIPEISALLSGDTVEFVPYPSDFIAVFATITLFISGELFGKLLQWGRSPRGKEPNAWATLLIPAIGTAAIGLLGNIVNALATAL